MKVHHGDALAVLATLPDASVDSVVTDPPYGLGFMGREWDALPPGVPLAAECLRVLKPGGHMLAFGGSRTWHRLACAIEDAGFDLRDSIAWLYGAGFPKSLDVSKAIDKGAGRTQPIVGPDRWAGKDPNGGYLGIMNDDGWVAQPDTARGMTAPVTDEARTWRGWGTALKPAFEPIVVARKPLAGTVAANVTEHGTGALNIDGCRVGQPEDKKHPGTKKYGRYDIGSPEKERQIVAPYTSGRWPANVVLDEHVAALVDEQSGQRRDGVAVNRNRSEDNQTSWYGTRRSQTGADVGYGGEGGASRFFYVAKAPKRERPRVNGVAHPTVKPLDLMRWLVRLVTPPGGTVLDPFAGSGTTVEACLLEGFDAIAIEREADYLPLIEARIARQSGTLFDQDTA